VTYNNEDAQWRVVSDRSYSSPNSLFVPNTQNNRHSTITTHTFTNVQELIFYNYYNTEGYWDGVALDVRIDGGSWVVSSKITTFFSFLFASFSESTGLALLNPGYLHCCFFDCWKRIH
jgi:hypothetical protein